MVELIARPNQGDHDVGKHKETLCLDVDRRLEDGTRLHSSDVRASDAQPAAPEPEHRVDLVVLHDTRVDGLQGDAKAASEPGTF